MKQEKRINQLCFATIMLSINIIFIVLNLFLPLFSLILLIGIPFSSALVKLKCNYKYTLLYIICSLLISFFIDFQSTLFYLFPSLISGLVFGILIKKNIHAYYLIICSSLINVLIQFFNIFIMNKFYQIDFIQAFCELIKVNPSFFNEIKLLFFFTFSFIQIILTYIVIVNEIHKFNYVVNEKNNLFYQIFILEIILFILSIFIKPLTYLFNGLLIINSCLILYYMKLANFKLINILSGSLYFFSFILTCCFYQKIKQYGFDSLFIIFSITTFVNSAIFIIYVKLIRKEKIDEALFNKISQIN